jgi:hypothetical protein
MGFRCPDNGKLRKPIFIVDPSLDLTAPRMVSSETLTLIGMTVMRRRTRSERLYSRGMCKSKQ